LPIYREIGDRNGEFGVLSFLGFLYLSMQPQKALDYFERALSIYREIEARDKEANALANIGTTYVAIGQLQKALNYYNQALSIYRELGNSSKEAEIQQQIDEVAAMEDNNKTIAH
jgi:tetratricopeptide (TPR) repeat protein